MNYVHYPSYRTQHRYPSNVTTLDLVDGDDDVDDLDGCGCDDDGGSGFENAAADDDGTYRQHHHYR